MNKLILIFLSLVLCPLYSSAQTNKKLGTTISVSTAINYYPAIDPYSFFSSFTSDDDELILNFLTANSGTFVIEEESISVEREVTSNIPSQLLGVGAGVQIEKGKKLFHEISLTKLSFAKSSYEKVFLFSDSLGKIRALKLGSEQKTSAFAFRYELGKYFGKRKKPSFRFGLSGSIEPSFYFFKRTPFSSREYPIDGKLFTIEVALIPMFSVKVSKKVSLDFKIIPNILMADFGSIKENNPLLSKSLQNGGREYNPPDINLAFSLLLKYKIKEPKKRRRSKQDG